MSFPESGIRYIRDVLTRPECQARIEASERIGYSEATVDTADGPKRVAAIRNNDRVIVDDVALAREYWARLRTFVPHFLDGRQAIGLNERFRYYRYVNGQAFLSHSDGVFRRENGEHSGLTLIIYLNDDFSGGETEFSSELITPETGAALIFRHELFHEGRAVERGTKYVLRSDVMFNPVGRISG